MPTKKKSELYDLVIVGAGPVGLSLALGLARAGKKVLLLEKKKELDPHSRAPAIWPRTQEVLAKLGVIAEFLDQGIVQKDVRMWDADKDESLFELPLHELENETKFAQFLVLPQQKTEQILLSALQDHHGENVKIIFAAEMLALHQSEESVQVSYKYEGKTQMVTAHFAVGCDGAHSRVRESLGFTLEGATYPVRAALADVRLKEKKAYPSPRISSGDIFAVGIMIEKDLWRLILPYEENDIMPIELRIRQAVDQVFHQTEYKIIWQSEFKLHRRLSSGFVRGRVALAGDAAHLNSPVGGQGMNSGIQDAEALIGSLLEAMSQNSTEPLSLYEKSRKRLVNEGVNRFTNQLTRTLFLGQGRYAKMLMKAANQALKIAPVRRAMLRRVAMLDV